MLGMLPLSLFINSGSFGPTNKYKFGSRPYLDLNVERSLEKILSATPPSIKAAAIISTFKVGEPQIQVSKTSPDRYEFAPNNTLLTPACQNIDSMSLAYKYASGSLCWYSTSSVMSSVNGAIEQIIPVAFDGSTRLHAVRRSISAVRFLASSARSLASPALRVASESLSFERRVNSLWYLRPSIPNSTSTETPIATKKSAPTEPHFSTHWLDNGCLYAITTSTIKPTMTKKPPARAAASQRSSAFSNSGSEAFLILFSQSGGRRLRTVWIMFFAIVATWLIELLAICLI